MSTTTALEFPPSNLETMKMASISIHSGELPPDFPSDKILDDARRINARDGHIASEEIAIGVVIGRASEYFDFFVFALASVLVFPSVFFPFEQRLEGTLYAFLFFAYAFIARPFVFFV